MERERRRSLRLNVTLPVSYEVLPAKEVELPAELADVYERVLPNAELAEEAFQGMVRDLSANGAFVTGPTVPLLSRLVLRFPLPGMSQVEAIGWVLWRRKEDRTIKTQGGGNGKSAEITLKAGFGVLFEAILPEARRHINRLAHMNEAAVHILDGSKS